MDCDIQRTELTKCSYFLESLMLNSNYDARFCVNHTTNTNHSWFKTCILVSLLYEKLNMLDIYFDIKLV